MKNKFLIPISFVVFIASFCLCRAGVEYFKEFNFNDDNALSKWGRMVLNGKVDYELMKEGVDGYVKALSEKTCSALYYRIGFKLEEYPVLSWKWRVLEFPDKSTVITEKDKDDYAARVYVVFPFLSFSSSKFIEYVWDKNLPVGTKMKSPQGDNIAIIVARSGPPNDESWESETRNVLDDYVSVFGEPPRLKVGAIAIMCDADNTKSTAESVFDDIKVGPLTGENKEL